jgi:hypothetical protein
MVLITGGRSEQIVPLCPQCGLRLEGHNYRLIATSILTPESLDAFNRMLGAARQGNWEELLTFQTWHGTHANAEVFLLRCPDGALSIVIISSPFALEDPHVLLYKEKINGVEAFPQLTDLDKWHDVKTGE